MSLRLSGRGTLLVAAISVAACGTPADSSAAGAGATTTVGAGGANGASGTGGASGTSGTSGTGGAGGVDNPDGGPVTTPTVVESLDISQVWSGDPVNFSLITKGNQQFAAYYDQNRQMSVAQRTLGDTKWTIAPLASTVGWDSHNYVTMAIDNGGFIHVSGNMHGVPLVYFRSTSPLDVTTLKNVPAMVGTNEQACTYPQFFRDQNNNLVYAYRDGASGDGNYIFDTYAEATKTWSRLLGSPLIDGQGVYSAYPVGPIRGPDGWFHLVWVWRDTPDASTNHDLSYAKSQDLVNWQTGAGKALTLPITYATADIVDPVPSGGGIINNNTKIGFDAQQHALLAYQKYDANGYTQIYNARLENNVWVSHQVSDWTFRWVFSGDGTLVFEVVVDPVVLQPNGDLTQLWYNDHYNGWGAFRLDPTTLAMAATIPPPLTYPAALNTPVSPTPGMVVSWAPDAGAGPDPKVLYMLRWETLPSNRDMPRATIPPPTTLRLYGIRQPG